MLILEKSSQQIIKTNPIEIYLVIMSDLDANCKTMKMINKKIADECLNNLILNAINTILKNKKLPDASSIYKFIHKELKNTNITVEVIEKRL